MSPAHQETVAFDTGPVTGRVRRLGILLAVAGAVGLLAASVLLVEKIRLLDDPAYVPSCSINPVLNCGSVMNTWQAEAFGLPNPIIGIAGFSVLLTVGVVVASGFEPRRWFWIGLQAGVTAGAVFVHWLIFQSLYRIGALCPYCMAVWAVVIPTFVYTTLFNLGSGHVRSRATPSGLSRLLIGNHGILVTGWFLVILALIADRFWDYWSTLV